MFEPKHTQSYESALAVIESGDAYLATLESYNPLKLKNERALKNHLELERELYVRFAAIAEKWTKEFVCGPFGEWDGTSRGMFYDGIVFGIHRQAFIDCLQHHHQKDAARYLWDFLTEYGTLMVLGPSVEVREISVVHYIDGSEREFETDEEAVVACSPGSNWASRGSCLRVKSRV